MTRITFIEGNIFASVWKWPVRFCNLSAYTSGKEAYVELMQKRYNNQVTTLNTTHNTDFRILGYISPNQKADD